MLFFFPIWQRQLMIFFFISYRRLVPEKHGVRAFNALMEKRLQKLGITERNPNKLTE
jgi:hypothetical protein